MMPVYVATSLRVMLASKLIQSSAASDFHRLNVEMVRPQKSTSFRSSTRSMGVSWPHFA